MNDASYVEPGVPAPPAVDRTLTPPGDGCESPVAQPVFSQSRECARAEAAARGRGLHTPRKIGWAGFRILGRFATNLFVEKGA